MRLSNEKKIFICFSILLFFMLFFWSLVLPFGNAPDEEGRFLVADYIFNHSRLPFGNEAEIRLGIWGFSYAFQPYLSYIFSAFFMKVFSLFFSSQYVMIVAARLVNIIGGLLMSYFVFQTGKLLFNEKKYAWIFTLLCMLLPMNLFIHVYVNTDSMALVSTSMIVYSWISGIKNNWEYKTCIILSIGLSLCALSYYNAYAFILCSPFLFIFSYVPKIKTKEEQMLFTKKLILIILLVFALCGWYFIRNMILYHGDLLGLKTRSYYAELYAADHLKPSMAHTYKRAGFSLFRFLKETSFIQTSIFSFIGMLGNMSVVLSAKIYLYWGLIFLLGISGSFLPSRCEENFPRKLYVSFLICIVVPIILSTYRSYTVDYQPQGRYLLPILLPFMFFVVFGIRKIECFFHIKFLSLFLLISLPLSCAYFYMHYILLHYSDSIHLIPAMIY